MKVYVSILLLFICGVPKSYAQDKFEKEYRIKEHGVPKDAVAFVNALYVKNKIKWYKEERMTGYSYEAKTNHRGINYSIEFDSLGKIEDVEYKISFAELPAEARKTMESHFDTSFQKWKIIKTQVHLVGTPQALIESIRQGEIPPTVLTKYELVVNGRVTKQRKLMEYLFADNGRLERTSTILQKNTDHLAY